LSGRAKHSQALSAGLLVVPPGSATGYTELAPGYAISVEAPAVLAAPDVHYQIVPPQTLLEGSRLTVYGLAAGEGTVAGAGAHVVVCDDGDPAATCVLLTAAVKNGESCFAQAGAPAPSACAQCGVRVVNAIISCEGGPTGQPSDLVPDSACNCATDVPTWYRCAGDEVDCDALCEQRGLSCSASCDVGPLCGGGPFGHYEVESSGDEPYCYEKGACDMAIGSRCSGSWNVYCCCGA
jgi:hypothetical protein